jgi:starch synthase
MTVSPQYAREIQTPEFGCGLEGVVGTRAEDLVGLVNGIDTRAWNPAKDRLLPARYAVHDLTGKAICRAVLLKKHGMDEAYQGPIFGMVCRLTEQKGLDFLLAARDFFVQQDCRLIVLGTGEKRFESALRDLAQAHPKKISLSAKHDEEMSHLIEAGADFFLMPSHFEPCGLNQMYSQVYGTVPVVTRVGGFVDTVVDIDEQATDGTGILCQPTAADFITALERAIRLYENKERLTEVIKRGMTREFGWQKAAAAYEQLYENTI